MPTSKFKWMRLALVLLMGLLAFGPLARVQSAKALNPPQVGMLCTNGPSFSLTAESGYILMPDMTTMYMWSYGTSGPEGFQHPGPVLCVNQGDTVTVTLTNLLTFPVSIMFPGQDDVQADGFPAQPEFSGPTLVSLTDSAAPSGGTVTYSFVATRPGTFIYESGTDPKMQVGMGLFGALVVRPTLGANYVNNRSDSQFEPTEEYLAILSEIDPYQHQAAELGINFNMNNYRARYWMLNGRGFPDSIADNNASWLPDQPYGALARIYPFDTGTHPYPALERFLNVGSEDYPFHPHGQNGLVINRDGYAVEGPGGQDLSMEKFAVNIGPGQAWDVVFKWYDAEGYNSTTNPVPSTIPNLVNIAIGMFYGGSPYLGEMETMPPGINTLNQCGEYYIISHNHALFQLDAWGSPMAGPITYLRVDPPLPNGCP